MAETQKRIRLGGDIDLPAKVAKQLLPDGETAPLKAIVEGRFTAEIEGDHTDRLKRRGGKSSIARTVTGTFTDLTVTDVRVPEPDPELPLEPSADADVQELVDKASTSDDEMANA